MKTRGNTRSMNREQLVQEVSRLKRIMLKMRREMDAELSWPPVAKCHQCGKPPEASVEVFCCMDHLIK